MTITVTPHNSNTRHSRFTLGKLISKQLGVTFLFSAVLHAAVLSFGWDLGAGSQRAQELVSSIQRERSPEPPERRIVTIANIQSEGSNGDAEQARASTADEETDDSEEHSPESPTKASDTPESRTDSTRSSRAETEPESSTQPAKPPEPTATTEDPGAVAAAKPSELEATTPPQEEETQAQTEPVPEPQADDSGEEPLADTSQATIAESGGSSEETPHRGTSNAASAPSEGSNGGDSSSPPGGGGDGDAPPSLRALSKTRVPYPRDAWANGWETTCRARLFIDTNGRVQRVEDIVCDAHTTVFAPALRSHILRWFRFTPAQRNGEPSRAVIRWEHDFRLNQ